MSPVTQVALVEVNSALKNGRDDPSLLEIGNINNNAPVKMTTIKPNGNTLIGFIPIFGLCIRLFVSPVRAAVSPLALLNHIKRKELHPSASASQVSFDSGRRLAAYARLPMADYTTNSCENRAARAVSRYRIGSPPASMIASSRSAGSGCAIGLIQRMVR